VSGAGAGPLDGKVAIVTGAGSLNGIGAATVRRLVDDGATVYATDRSAEACRAVAEATGATGARSRGVDITDRAQIDACVAAVIDEHGRLDILVNNAGIAAGGKPFLEITDEDWQVSFAVNVKGTADFCQAAIPPMLERGEGCIVNLSSMAGIGAQRAFGAYTAAKHALIGLTKTIAAEFGPQGLRCTAICPGFIASDMHEGVNKRLAAERGMELAAFKAQRYESVALRRAGTPDEVAALIGFVCGPGGSYITGVALPVTGGVQLGL
jgi:NAD(P)-dependent dehydrogenase (short-subunit alcohol dehydrogenase family)